MFITFCFAAITLVIVLAWICDVSVTSSKLTLDVHPRYDSTELAEAVMIGFVGVYNQLRVKNNEQTI